MTPSRTITPPAPDTGTAALDRRRGKWQAAQLAAAKAADDLVVLDAQLDADAAQRRADEAELQAAIDRQAELKRSLKASAKRLDGLRATRKHLARDGGKALRRARSAEAKYEKALLADMVRVQKGEDLSAHDGTAQDVTQGAANEAFAAAAPRRRATTTRRRTSGTTATSTAKKTAAVVTARKARG